MRAARRIVRGDATPCRQPFPLSRTEEPELSGGGAAGPARWVPRVVVLPPQRVSVVGRTAPVGAADVVVEHDHHAVAGGGRGDRREDPPRGEAPPPRGGGHP